MKHTLSLTAALLVAMGAPSLAMAQSTSSADKTHTAATHNEASARPDSWVLTKVKAQFATSDIVDATDINVDVTNGQVKLRGTVSGDAEKREAVRLAKGTEGVKSVDDSGLVMSRSEPEEEARKARMERNQKR